MAQFGSGSVVSYAENEFHKGENLNTSSPNASVTASATSFDIDDETNVTTWPSDTFVVWNEDTDELFYVNNRSGSTLESLTRGFGGTTAASMTTDHTLHVVQEASDRLQVRDEIIDVQDVLSGNTTRDLTVQGTTTDGSTSVLQLQASDGTVVADFPTDQQVVVAGTQNSNNRNLRVQGDLEADTLHGDGSALTGISDGTGGVTNSGSTTIGADTDDDGTGVIAFQIGGTTEWEIENSHELNSVNSASIQDAGTDAISFNGSQDVAIPNGGFLVGGTGSPTGNQEITDTGAATLRMTGDSDESITASGSTLAAWEGAWNDTVVGKWEVQTGDDDTNAHDGDLVGFISQGGTLSEVARFHQEGHVEFGQAGNVGIGTTPSNIFEIDAGTAFWQASRGGSNEAQWQLKRDENPGDGALIAILDMVAQNSGGNDTVYGRIRAETVDVTDGNEDGRVEFQTIDAGNAFTVPFAIESGHAEVATPTSTTGTSLIVSSDSSTLQEVARSSSTRRHKTDIQYLSPEDVNPQDVLAIDPAHFWMDEDHGDCPDAGFIAEDWHGLHPDLDDGLDYDDQGRVSGFRVDSRVIDAAQQLVLQDHDSRIETNEERVERLEGENERLRDRVQELEAAA